MFRDSNSSEPLPVFASLPQVYRLLNLLLVFIERNLFLAKFIADVSKMMPPETLIPAPSQETASLVKQLAGPSTGKAGSVATRFTLARQTSSHHCVRLAQDQSEINRIIAEASKGSKFYEASRLCLLRYQVKPEPTTSE